MAPFHIKAQFLRRSQLEPAAALGVFEPRAAKDSSADETKASGRRGWRQSDVKRAIAAAEQAGLVSYRVEITPDGTIGIIVGDPLETAAIPDSYAERPEA